MTRMRWFGVAVGALLTLVPSDHLTSLSAQTRSTPATVNWSLHNLDLAGTRYSTLDLINRSNVKTLAPRWLFQHGVIDGVSNQTTPIVVDGTMYVTDSRGSVYAVDAADGHLLWSYDVTAKLGGGAREGYVFRNRGVTNADGVIYTAGGYRNATVARVSAPAVLWLQQVHVAAARNVERMSARAS